MDRRMKYPGRLLWSVSCSWFERRHIKSTFFILGLIVLASLIADAEQPEFGRLYRNTNESHFVSHVFWYVQFHRDGRCYVFGSPVDKLRVLPAGVGSIRYQFRTRREFRISSRGRDIGFVPRRGIILSDRIRITFQDPDGDERDIDFVTIDKLHRKYPVEPTKFGPRGTGPYGPDQG